jgi:DNA-binding response OmpR family regulator
VIEEQVKSYCSGKERRTVKRILIIEDDPIIARVYGMKYSSAGFETAIAHDGEAGMALLGTFKPDLVHLDLGVPKVNGAEIIRRIRTRFELRSLPVIVLSNTYQNRLVKTAIDAGASECVSKATCTPKMMVEIVEKHLARADAAKVPPPNAPVAPPIEASIPKETEAATPDAAAAPKAPEQSAPEPSAPPAAPAPTPVWDSSLTRETERHIAFQADIRRDFRKRAPQLISALEERVVPLLRRETDADRGPELVDLCRAAEKLASHSGIAGYEELAQMSSALVALLKDLVEKPNDLTASSLRTIVDACDSLSVPRETATEADRHPGPPSVVLVVDDDAICRRAVVSALARLNVATVSVDDPQMALRLLAENRFNLAFLDVNMPGMNGFDLCAELRKEAMNRTTPVVFVTSLEDFESRDRAMASGANDLIAKPFLPMELAVKALSLLPRE